jgi:tetratricopeptide (TPR) repeat protein
MKKIPFFIFLVLLAAGLKAQHTVRILVLNHSINPPKSEKGVIITPLTGGGNAGSTNDAGIFDIKLSTAKPGDRLDLIVNKLDYQILGPDPRIFNYAVPNNPSEYVRIAIIKTSDFNASKADFEVAIEKRIKQATSKLDRVIDSLQKAVNDDVRTALAKTIKIQSDEINELRKNKEELATRFAQVDLEQASEFARLALKKFKEEGDVKVALAMMPEDKLDAFWSNVLLHEEKVTKAKAQGVENYMLRARLLIANLQFSSAYESYLKAIDKDSTDIDNLWEVARFFNKQREFQQATKLYEKILNLNISELEKGVLLNNLIGLYAVMGKNMEAEQAIVQALDLLQKLSAQNPIYQEYLAMVLENKGRFNASNLKISEAEQAYQEALRINRNLSTHNPAFLVNLAATLFNLGDFYYTLKNYKNAEHAFLEALSIRRNLKTTTAYDSEHGLALTLYGLGSYYTNTKQLNKAESALKESSEIFVNLSAKNPAAYKHYEAGSISSLGDCFRLKKEFDQAKRQYLRSIELFKPLLLKDPLQYFEELVIVFNNFGENYFSQDSLVKAEQYYNEALSVLNNLPNKDGDTFQASLAITQYNLANLYRASHKIELSEKNALSALAYFQKISLKNKEIYSFYIIGLLNNLALVYLAQGNSLEGERKLVEALTILDKFIIEKPDAYLPLKAQILNSAGFFLSKTGKLLDAQKAYKQSITLYITLISEKNADYSKELIQTVLNLKNVRDSLFLRKELGAVIETTNFIIHILTNKNLHIEPSTAETISNEYGFLAWRYLFARDYQSAFVCSEKSLNIDPNQKWVNSPLAFSLVLNGDYVKAEAIFLSLKDEYLGKNSFRNVFLGDMDYLEKAGIFHPDFKKIRKILAKP